MIVSNIIYLKDFIYKLFIKKLNKLMKNLWIIISFFEIILSIKKEYKLKKINLESRITIKIKGSGQKNILYSEFSNLPNQVLINNVIQNTSTYKYNFQDEISVIVMKWNNNFKDCSNMFNAVNCITEVDFTYFDSSIVNNMYNMFQHCTSLTSINFRNFDTSSVTKMSFMFDTCIKLTSIDLSGFITSSVVDINAMFDDCWSLKQLDLSNFDTSKVTDMNYMFFNNWSLTSINLSNFNTSKVTNFNYMFAHCRALKSINIYSFTITSGSSISSIFYNTSDTLIYCYDKNKASYLSSHLSSKIQGKYIIEKKICIEECYSDKKWIYNNLCYSSCPTNTYKYNQSECLDSIPNGYYLSDQNTRTIDKCHSDCLTCEQKYIYNNTNCKSCPSGKYYDLGNCVSSCQKGTYFDINDNNIEKCKCPNSKCEICSIEGLSNQLCITCNLGYYPKFNDNLNSGNLINCYNSLEGYYLDINENIFKPCYNTCLTCNEYGDQNNNNCEKCIKNYIFRNFTNNDKNCYENCVYYYYFDKDNNYYCTKNDKCPENYKLILEKNKCIDNCSNDDIYQFEYQKQCFSECPKDTKIKNKQHYCENLCPKELPYELTEVQICVKNCSVDEISKNICILNNKNAKKDQSQNDQTLSEFQDNIVNGNFKEIISKVNQGEDFVFEDNDISYTFTNTKTQKDNINNNISTIDLGECENELKKHYKIHEEQSLFIFKVEVKGGLKISKLEYEVYYPLDGENMTKLNLSVCQNISILVSNPVDIDENNLDKHNIKSGYYNDICYTYTSENGTDISLEDRKKEFVENDMTLCEEKCEFIEYDKVTKKAKCSCEVKIKLPLISEIVIDKNLLYKSFSKMKNIANMKVLKCYYILFTKKVFLNNIGIYIIIFVLLFHILCLIIFYCKDFEIIKKTIQNIIKAKKDFKSKVTFEQNYKKTDIKNEKEKSKKIKKEIKIKNKISEINNNKKNIRKKK